VATIGAAVSEKMKEQFVEMAKARTWTPSRLAGELITQFLADELKIEEPSATPPKPSLILPTSPLRVHEAKTKQVFVRLAPFYYEELGRLASERGWHRGTHLAEMFYAHYHCKPRFCDAEINALRQVARQLADMGRNINQIARKLNSSPDEAHECPRLGNHGRPKQLLTWRQGWQRLSGRTGKVGQP
jgi:hypothetical protein